MNRWSNIAFDSLNLDQAGWGCIKDNPLTRGPEENQEFTTSGMF
jgi:hypothetical protein